MKRRILSWVLAAVLALSLVPMAAAANYSTSYSSYSTPGSSDYAYWNGSKVVRGSGTTTSEVKWMQAALNYCIKNKGLNASYLDVDGSFGPASQSATKAFQRKYGLSVDGSFGPSTIAKMKEVLKPAETPAPTTPTPSTPTPTQADHTVDYSSFSTPGSSDYAYWNGSQVVRGSDTTISEVKWMQAALNYCIQNKGLNASYLDVDGSFGPASQSATKVFQRKYGLSVDGSFGPSTIAQMKEVLNPTPVAQAKPAPVTPQPVPDTPEPAPNTPTPAQGNYTTDYNSFSAPDSSDYAYWNGSQVVRGSDTTTSEIKWIQAALNYCIANKGLNASYLDVDGSFGPASQSATEVFQRKYGLSVDGSFGPGTIQKMKEVLGLVPVQTDPKPVEPDPPADTSVGTYDLCWPVPSSYTGYKNVTSSMGNRTAPVSGASTNHKGIDIGVSTGTPVMATADGVVKFTDKTDGRGKYVCVYHPSIGITSVYQHLSSYSVSPGQSVTKGQQIATSGNTGNSSGPHLHFELVLTASAPRSVDVAWASNAKLLNGHYANTSISYEYLSEPLGGSSAQEEPQIPTEPDVQMTEGQTDYASYSAPGSSDYAYWNGSKSVLGSQTTTSEVKWMQAALNHCIKKEGLSAFYLEVDGSFGPASKAATSAFQQKYGLSVDGSFGPGTIVQMKKLLGIPVSEPIPSKNSSSGTAAIPYNAWVPVKPTYTNAAGSRSADAYNRAIDQFNVRTNGRYKPFKLGKGDTYCNIFAWDVSIAMGAEVAHWVGSDGKAPKDNNTGKRELGANSTAQWLKKYGEDYGWRTVSAKEAQKRANQGYPTVGSFDNSPRVGHIVVVRPETSSKHFSSSAGPVIAQAGSSNFDYGYIRGSGYQNYTFYTHD